MLVVTAGLFVALELGVRGYRWFRAESDPATQREMDAPFDWNEFKIVPVDASGNLSEAYREFQWAKDFVRQQELYSPPALRYEPFSLWRHPPYHSPYVNYQEDGFRRTVHPAKEGASQTFEIFVLGASTIAGDGVLRDEDVIPSLLAKILNERNPYVFFRVSNYG